MIDSKIVSVIAETLDSLEDQILQNFALSAILAQSGMSHAEIDDAVRKVLEQPDVKRETTKLLFPYRTMREDVDRRLRERHGATLPPPRKVN